MTKKKHKRKVSRVLIFTSDAVDAKEKQLKLHPWVCNFLLLVFCVVVGSVIGYFMNESKVWTRVQDVFTMQNKTIASLQEENEDLNSQIESLNAKLAVLSDTVNKQTQDAQALREQIDEQTTPSAFPLTGTSSNVQDFTEEEPICVWEAEENITVVATAVGSVLMVEDDAIYGHKITIDHGNGYQTIYCNKGEVQVKEGDNVAKGTTLFIIGSDNRTLGYQIKKDGIFINPLDVLSVSG